MSLRKPCRWLPWCVTAVLVAGLARTAAVEAEEGAVKLPLKRVVLFSSGVGYFQHDGQVRDNAQVELKFKTENINDLLKSMVVEDQGRPGLGRQLRLERPGEQDAQELRPRPDQQPHAGRVVEPGPRRAGRNRGPEQDQRHDPGRGNAEKGSRQGQDYRGRVLNLLTDEGLRAVPLDDGEPDQVDQRQARRRAAARPWPCWPAATPRTRRP